MWNRIREFISAPIFRDDEDKTRRARVLNALHLNMGISLLILGTIGVFFLFEEKSITFMIFLTGIFSVGIGMALNRQGYVRESGLLMLAVLWSSTLLMMTVSGGMRSLDIIFFVSGTVAAGIVFGARGGILYAGLSLLTGLAVIAAENAGVKYLQLFGFPPIGAWIVLFINLAFTVIPLQVTFKNLAEAATHAQASEERYRLIASVISDYVFSIQYGPNREITNHWLSGAFESITGYEPGEYIAKGGWRSIVHPNDRDRDELDMTQLHSNKNVVSELRIVRKDGEVRWVRSYAHPKWDETENRLAGIYGAVQDITEHKLVDGELQQRAEEVSLLYRISLALAGGHNLYDTLRAFVQELKNVMVVDAFHIGLYDAETDNFSYPLFLNLGEDLQLPPRKLRENPGLTWEVISDRKTLYLTDITNPQTQRDHHIIIVVDAGMRSYIGIPLMLQNRVIGVMSVQSIMPNAYSQEQIRLLETLAAQVAGTIEKLRLFERVQQELAERKRTEAELQERETILEIAAEAANTFLKVSEWSADAWKTEVNKLLERLGGTIHASHAYVFENRVDKNGLIRMSMRYEWTAPGFSSDLEDPVYQDMPMDMNYLESWETCVLSGIPYIGDAEHLSQEDIANLQARNIQALLDVPIYIDGQWWGTIGFDDMARPRNWSPPEVDALVVAGNLLGAAIKRRQVDSILQDELRQRKTLIGELEAKNAELERFTYTVSHDLRSPLVTIQGFLGFLEKSAREGNMSAFHKDMQRISKATLRMDNLLKDVLELSRIGRVLNKPQDTPFALLVKEALEIVHGQLDKKGITLQLQPGLPIVHGDRPRLVEVLQNLIDNAAKYMGNQVSPAIWIGKQEQQDENGMPIFYVKDNGMGIAPEYYERVFDLFEKLNPESAGTGIGLALVKRIIEFHGGRIWVESGGGEGTTFLFTLPITKSKFLA